jgi:hypothetical protein
MVAYKYFFWAFLLIFSTGAIAQQNTSHSEKKEASSVTQKNANGHQSNDTTQPSAPRQGKYLIISYGSNPVNPMKIGYFSLSGSEYIYYDMEGKQLGEGTYNYDSEEKHIRWQSGPFKAIGWGGEFETDNNGRTHNIRLKSSTIGTNTIE